MLTARVYVGAVLAFLFLPAIAVVALSFNSSPRIGIPFEGLTVDWYDRALSNPALGAALQNTVTAAFATALISGLLGALTAFAIVRLRPRAAGAVTAAALLPALVPALLLGVALNLTLRELGFAPGLPAIVVAHTLIATPFVTLTMVARLREFDRSLPEAARDLGASPLRAFGDVTLPLVRAALVAAMLLAAALSIDEFVATFFVRGGQDTVPTVLWAMMRRGVDPTVNALATLLLAGIVALALIASRATRARL